MDADADTDYVASGDAGAGSQGVSGDEALMLTLWERRAALTAAKSRLLGRPPCRADAVRTGASMAAHGTGGEGDDGAGSGRRLRVHEDAILPMRDVRDTLIRRAAEWLAVTAAGQ